MEIDFRHVIRILGYDEILNKIVKIYSRYGFPIHLSPECVYLLDNEDSSSEISTEELTLGSLARGRVDICQCLESYVSSLLDKGSDYFLALKFVEIECALKSLLNSDFLSFSLTDSLTLFADIDYYNLLLNSELRNSGLMESGLPYEKIVEVNNLLKSVYAKRDNLLKEVVFKERVYYFLGILYYIKYLTSNDAPPRGTDDRTYQLFKRFVNAGILNHFKEKRLNQLIDPQLILNEVERDFKANFNDMYFDVELGSIESSMIATLINSTLREGEKVSKEPLDTLMIRNADENPAFISYDPSTLEYIISLIGIIGECKVNSLRASYISETADKFIHLENIEYMAVNNIHIFSGCNYSVDDIVGSLPYFMPKSSGPLSKFDEAIKVFNKI